MNATLRVMQVAYSQQRAVYESAVEEISAWLAEQPTNASNTANSTAPFDPTSTSPRLGSPLLREPDANVKQPETPAATSPHSQKSRRATRKGSASARSGFDSTQLCPYVLPAIAEPIPSPEVTKHLVQSLASTARAPWADAVTKFEAVACAMALPVDTLTPPPRPPVDTPPPTPPPEPLPLNGYLWSALGKTAFVQDGFDMSKDKLEHLLARAAERAAAAQTAA